MSRWARILLAVVMIAVTGCSVWFLFKPPTAVDSVTGVARYYGVSEETVRDVARAYDVDPAEIASYGEAPFPVNYIRHTLGWTPHRASDSTIYREDVDALMTGYVSKCDLSDTTTLYLFYSDWLRPKTLFRGEALPVEISYEPDVARDGARSDQVVQDITFYFLSDSGGPLWEQVAPHCDPPAKY